LGRDQKKEPETIRKVEVREGRPRQKWVRNQLKVSNGGGGREMGERKYENTGTINMFGGKILEGCLQKGEGVEKLHSGGKEEKIKRVK